MQHSGIKDGSLIIESLPDIEFSRCIAKIYVRSLSNIKDILKKASAKIKEVVSIAEKLEPVRDKLIAHFDISDIDTAQNVKMHINEFVKIYDLSCEILELLSLGYFNYKDVFSQKMIQANNFKFFVCQDPWCHNPNQYYESDIDSYLKTIKMKFDACNLDSRKRDEVKLSTA